MDSNDDKELEPLKNAVMSVLESDGTLNEIRANLRANVFRVCDNSYKKQINIGESNKQNDEKLLINQLIKEYLKFNGFKHSLNVFNAESGDKSDSNIDRLEVQNQLKFDPKLEETNNLPLLNTVIKHFLDRKPSN